jgi:hypothetical protein
MSDEPVLENVSLEDSVDVEVDLNNSPPSVLVPAVPMVINLTTLVSYDRKQTFKLRIKIQLFSATTTMITIMKTKMMRITNN